VAEFDAASGALARLCDVHSGVELIDPQHPAPLLEYVLERPGGMSSWRIHPTQQRVCPLEVHALRLAERGPHVASVVVEGRVKRSSFRMVCAVRAGEPALQIDLKVNWLEVGGPQVGTPSLKFHLPLALQDARGRYEVPFGSIQRPQREGQEVPALRWADVTGKTAEGKAAGCLLLNDCRHGHSLDGAVLRLTLLRSSYEPDPLPEMGEHRMRIGLVPHAGRLPPADCTRLAVDFDQPPHVLATDVHAGRLPPAGGAVRSVRPGAVVLSSIKKAEDDAALIFRLIETRGRTANARVSLDPALLGTPTAAVEVDLLERPLDESTAGPTADGFTVRVPANGIASVKVTFAEPAPLA
jgi:alpha-mannosidase